MRTIYLDYNATTQVDARVREAMLPFLEEIYGNPSSVHQIGRRARALLDEARDRCATVLGSKPSEVIFTSGGTESNNLAIFGTVRLLRSKGKHVITSSIEHHAVLNCLDYLESKEGFEVTQLPVSREGVVSQENLRSALRPDTILVSIMAANNEIGSIQPVAEIGAICRERGVLFHTDAVQWFGKESFNHIGQFNADLVSVCGHKFHGPKGAGILYCKSPLLPEPILFGGAHENERRAGTENLPAIIGLTVALERFVRDPVFQSIQVQPLRDELRQIVRSIPGVHLVGSEAACLNNTVSFLTEGADAISLLANLDLEGICASGGAACSAGSIEPSHVVLALGDGRELANSLVRFSLGRENTVGDLDRVAEVLPKIVQRAQRPE